MCRIFKTDFLKLFLFALTFIYAVATRHSVLRFVIVFEKIVKIIFRSKDRLVFPTNLTGGRGEPSDRREKVI